MRPILFCFIWLSLALSTPAWGEQPYDLIFKKGTLSDISKQDALVYDRDVEVLDDKDKSKNQDGKIKLTFEEEEMARLKFLQGEKFRNVGTFPATVGNPIIMYFVETVIRDVASSAGGSPFYIRNRIKASLVQEAPIESGTATFDGKEVPVQIVTLRPFLNDKNRSKMRGYQHLALTVTMSPDIPGWYHSLVATTTANDDTAPVYSNAVKLAGEGQNK